MAETSAALRFSPFSSLSSFARAKDSSFSSFSAAFPPNSHPCPSRLLRFPAKLSSNSSNSLPDDLFGFFPWSNDSEIEWVTEERVTLFTCDGLIQIGGSMVPRRITSSNKKQGRSKTTQRFQRFQESDYMDTEQGLCLGALFDIAATNGLDMGRRLCIFGFCRSIEMLSDVVEDTVLEHGGEGLFSADVSPDAEVYKFCGKPACSYPVAILFGGRADTATFNSQEPPYLWRGVVKMVCITCTVMVAPYGEVNFAVVAAEKAMKGGLHEKLRMTVAVPLLWGVPPAAETLHLAVKCGGGIVDKVYWQWDFL
ncbi:hypothetical protein DVH24_004684 [Malus domestica]|uniref:DUF7811 domain-containing protein n=1 Tax=Malus domestica TaxID=3750 RepID=A0A498IC20_MALDO|nr:hypothetical protein DVH24_004684 [Malus domestica]